MKFWNADRTQSPAINIGVLEKYMFQETVTRAGNLGHIEEENAPEENGNTPAEDGGTTQLNNENIHLKETPKILIKTTSQLHMKWRSI